MHMKPKVSIICITYNQEKYITKTLDSFLMQKTDFNFEVLVHDDASTDGTVGIIKKYQKKFPDVIKPIFEKENQYSKMNWYFINDMYVNAKGKYIAVCEGDDYWTYEYKLQKQVDFLEKNKSYTLCFHKTRIFFENNERKEQISPQITDAKYFNTTNLLKDNFIHTCSVMYRAQNYDDLPDYIMPQDLYVHLYHASKGKIGFINEVMSAYRRQPNGVWWGSHKNMDDIYIKYNTMLVSFYLELQKLFSDSKNYLAIINNHLTHLLNRLSYLDKKQGSELMLKTIHDYPNAVAEYIINRNKMIHQYSNEITKLANANKGLKDDIYSLGKIIEQHESEIITIKSTKAYRLDRKLKKIAHK